MNKKYSNKTKEKVIEQYLSGVSVSNLVSKFNVSRTTVYTWIEAHKKNTSNRTLIVRNWGVIHMSYPNNFEPNVYINNPVNLTLLFNVSITVKETSLFPFETAWNVTPIFCANSSWLKPLFFLYFNIFAAKIIFMFSIY